MLEVRILLTWNIWVFQPIFKYSKFCSRSFETFITLPYGQKKSPSAKKGHYIQLLEIRDIQNSQEGLAKWCLNENIWIFPSLDDPKSFFNWVSLLERHHKARGSSDGGHVLIRFHRGFFLLCCWSRFKLKSSCWSACVLVLNPSCSRCHSDQQKSEGKWKEESSIKQARPSGTALSSGSLLPLKADGAKGALRFCSFRFYSHNF